MDTDLKYSFATFDPSLIKVVCPQMTSCDCLISLHFDRATDIQTESDAHEPTVHTHRWAQNCSHCALVSCVWPVYPPLDG